MKKFVAILCVISLVFSLYACNKAADTQGTSVIDKVTEGVVKVTEKLTDISDKNITLEPLGRENDEDSMLGPLGYGESKNISDATADFGFELFRYALENGDNSLVSPVSVMAALSMATDGANGETLAEMERVLGMTNENLRKHYGGYVHPANSSEELRFANSLWLRNDGSFQVNKNFVERTLEAYGADVFSEPFDAETKDKINYWISENTDGEIENMLDEIPPEAVSYIINTVLFEAEWAEKYYDTSIRENQTFTAANGEKQTVTMMGSEENYFVRIGKTKGFIKNYKGGEYAFVGLLPYEGVSVKEAAASFSGEDFLNAVNNAEVKPVDVIIPKFSFDCKFLLNDTLKAMGMPTAFNSANADFTNLGTSPMGNIYISRVLHNTFIRFDEAGTTAGAATVVEMMPECAMLDMEYLTFDRPFIYAIVDTSTGMPIFIGAVENFK